MRADLAPRGRKQHSKGNRQHNNCVVSFQTSILDTYQTFLRISWVRSVSSLQRETTHHVKDSGCAGGREYDCYRCWGSGHVLQRSCKC